MALKLEKGRMLRRGNHHPPTTTTMDLFYLSIFLTMKMKFNLNKFKFLKRGKAPGADTIHHEVLRLGTITLLYHHLARLFTSSIQLGYISTAWKLVTLRMLLKPDKLPSLTTSYRPISLISSIMKLFERIIEQRLRSHLEHIGFINKHQSGFRKAKSTDDHLFRLSQPIMESFNRGNMWPRGVLPYQEVGGGGGGVWTWHRVQRQNLGQGSVKFTK